MIARLIGLFALLCLLAASAAVAGGGPRSVGPGEMLRGRFVQERHLTGFDKPLRTEGSFVLVAGQGLLWRSERPIASATAIGPGGVLQTVAGQEAMRIPASQAPALAQFFETLSAALSGDLGALASHFAVERSVEAERWRVVLRPKDAASPVASIALTGGALPERVEIAKSQGDREVLRFFDQSVAPAALAPDEAALLGEISG
jgi:hypothetical protein